MLLVRCVCDWYRQYTVYHHTGDGGNDVSMIQAANVGIGIVGKVCMRVCQMCSM